MIRRSFVSARAESDWPINAEHVDVILNVLMNVVVLVGADNQLFPVGLAEPVQLGKNLSIILHF